MKTIVLNPEDYGGWPKTAVSSQSYFGGFFNTQANFKK